MIHSILFSFTLFICLVGVPIKIIDKFYYISSRNLTSHFRNSGHCMVGESIVRIILSNGHTLTAAKDMHIIYSFQGKQIHDVSILTAGVTINCSKFYKNLFFSHSFSQDGRTPLLIACLCLPTDTSVRIRPNVTIDQLYISVLYSQ